jgi:riboflavin kinase/FMN adenylyltransferase
VYACLADGSGIAGPVPAAVSIGVRPTFQTGRGELIEAYVLDFDGDLYGGELQLEFLERLRGERRFDSSEALVEQMHRDVERTREVVAASEPRD